MQICYVAPLYKMKMNLSLGLSLLHGVGSFALSLLSRRVSPGSEGRGGVYHCTDAGFARSSEVLWSTAILLRVPEQMLSLLMLSGDERGYDTNLYETSAQYKLYRFIADCSPAQSDVSDTCAGNDDFCIW